MPGLPCHDLWGATTYGEWHETAHAGVGVQCTSCHLPHSQETRLDDEALCGSCHREELSDWAHQSAGVTCTDCHLSSRAVPEGVADVRVGGGGMAPDHSFEHVVESCTNCHGQSIHQQVFHETSHEIDSAQLSTMVERAGELARQLEDAKRTNRTLQTLSVVSLGFGLGAGGVLGMIFVLVVGYISQGRRQT
jgi:formate-dependent nitrite reductase cytochrome c552 subunit